MANTESNKNAPHFVDRQNRCPDKSAHACSCTMLSYMMISALNAEKQKKCGAHAGVELSQKLSRRSIRSSSACMGGWIMNAQEVFAVRACM